MNPTVTQELHAAAALCDDRAARLEAAGDVLAARAVTATWAGPAADRFRLLMVERRNELRAGAASLRDTAATMRAIGSMR
jgi:hypothetical protein